MTDLPIDPEEHFAAGERALLLSFLDWYRAVFIRKCEGLSDAQARLQACPPSNLTLVGLARHMAEVERNWFRRVLAGVEVEPLYSTEDWWDADFEDIETATVADALAALSAEIDHGRQLVEATGSLDQLAAHPQRRPSLRWILVHMIEEYARHCGHADLIRQAIDGATGD